MGGYATLMALFAASCAAFVAWMRRAGVQPPERVAAGDLALLGVATYKLSRLITRDRVTSTLRAPFTRFQDDAGPGEVDEAARGRGLRRAVGELLVCPFCIGMWISTAFVAALVAVPRTARLVASIFTLHTISDVLQLAYRGQRLARRCRLRSADRKLACGPLRCPTGPRRRR